VIRYTYVQLPGRPPAPFVKVTVRTPAPPPDELADQPAQIDTGADRTVIPFAVVKHLGLLRFGSLRVAGLGGIISRLDTYLVVIELSALPPLTVEVIAADEPWILLGRDVDNHFRMLLDGPGTALEIG
jgi:predicted aspartyl protease